MNAALNSPTPPPSTAAGGASTRSIVVVDFVGFTAKNTEYQILGGIAGASVLITVIGEFVKAVLDELGIPSEPHDVFDPDFPVLKYTGDGVIMHFAQAQDAVNFAVGLQQKSQAHNLAQEKLDDPKKELGYRVFRIGIATGEVLPVQLSTMRTADLAGSMIGDAARLEAACQHGAVLICGATYQQLADRAGFSDAFQVDGKGSDGKRYTVHQRVVAERAQEFSGKIPYWRIHPTTDSVVARIELRIRHQLPPLAEPLAKKLAKALGVAEDAEALIGVTKNRERPDLVLKNLASFVAGEVPDLAQWVSELALLTTCRQIDFEKLVPPRQVKDPTWERAYVMSLKTSLSLVAAMCVAGMVGICVRMDRASALSVEFTAGEPSSESTLDALRQLYRQLYRADANPNWRQAKLEGDVRTKLQDALDNHQILNVLLVAPGGNHVIWLREAECLAISINHLVALSVGDDLARMNPKVHMGVLQTRLENILQQQLFDDGRR